MWNILDAIYPAHCTAIVTEVQKSLKLTAHFGRTIHDELNYNEIAENVIKIDLINS